MNGLLNSLPVQPASTGFDASAASSLAKDIAPSLKEGENSFKETLDSEIASQKVAEPEKETIKQENQSNENKQSKLSKTEQENEKEKINVLEKKSKNEINEKKENLAKEKKVSKKEIVPFQTFSLNDVLNFLNQVQLELQEKGKINGNTEKKLSLALDSLNLNFKQNHDLTNSDKKVQIQKIITLLEGVKESKDASKALKDNLNLLLDQLKKGNIAVSLNESEEKKLSLKNEKISHEIKDSGSLGEKQIVETNPHEKTQTLSKKEVSTFKNDKGDEAANKEAFSKNEAPNLSEGVKSLNFQKEFLNQMDKHASNIDHRAIVAKLSHQVVKTHMLGENKMIMKLFPEHLGKITVHLDKVGNDSMSVKMIVESSAIKEIMDSRFSQLKQQLEEAGLNLTEVSVSLSQGQSNPNKENSFHEEASKIGRGSSRGKTLHLNETTTDSSIDLRRNSNGLLNIVA